jgi:hypothetical protein
MLKIGSGKLLRDCLRDPESLLGGKDDWAAVQQPRLNLAQVLLFSG